ncbi:MAG: type III glutamate--ammonia ligase [Proteobacteria bacterium]|nr:type III glutamate--ammonia ligase [Pseudomonadota bacterium]MBI3499825.1 type III glutamate--ammonia ligase [Pseudomonadota bacterium]
MSIDLAKVARDKRIEYFLISFVDMAGTSRAKLVPASAIAIMQKNGAGFAGFATHLDMTPADPDMFAMPDAESLVQLPWKPELGWLAADLWMEGKPILTTPRLVLKRLIAQALKAGYRQKSGVECEFMLIQRDQMAVSDPFDAAKKPCYDQQALMRRYDVIRAICDGMQRLGWGPYQNDHEDANGQFEMNWEYADALVTADRHTFFKFMVKSIAEQQGLRATFMPKPFMSLTGNGCHVHMSLWNPTAKRNLFEDPKGELGLAALAYKAIGGLVANAEPLAALFNPTVNSYKRINAPVTLSGATWSPNTVTYSGNNRTHMIRIPEPGRFELRLPDGAANPYLLQAGVLAAALDGIGQNRDPGKRLDVNMYEEGHRIKGAKRLPLNLLDAVRVFEKSQFARQAFGDAFVESYAKLKHQDWKSYMAALSPWELQQTVDC